MGDSTTISWTDATWNPVRGCSRVSEGCRHCYAERVAARFSDEGQPYHGLAQRVLKMAGASQPRWTGVVRFIPEHVADPMRWKRPRRIFVNSMSDLFHEKLDDDAIDQVFAVMALAGHHTYQVLTKRADRMRRYITTPGRHEAWSRHILKLGRRYRPAIGGVSDEWWPRHARNIWLGVSVENQDAADHRIPELLMTPAAVRFLSCEPLLGPIDLTPKRGVRTFHLATRNAVTKRPSIDWIIAGCESGPGARSCDVEWLRSLRDQCAAAGVPFFLKQAVECMVRRRVYPSAQAAWSTTATVGAGAGSKLKGGGVIELPYLDGVQHAQFPTVIQ